ncbi:hypothetical protein EXIGLDRAFT_716152 [Exidia glandulosa HHB12029]|uniref:Spindle pole body component n=1 Tax=Exidia glandulosa HHB12029 TaxID=1314781 RepID=A0A165QW57_EXIGL|nr:hypothetical protein EXIGLDRAFT_716152 [Exidia glandulosa HHB12029]
MPPQPPRPASAIASRLAHRPLSRHGPSPFSAARQQALTGLTRTLVSRTLTVAEDDVERVNAHVDRIVAQLANTSQAHNVISRREVDASYRDYEQRLRVTHSADVANALRDASTRLGALNIPITQQTALVEVLQFLLISANTPGTDTLTNAAAAREESGVPMRELTWSEIMNDPPFEGEHWVDDDDNESSGSLSDASLMSSFSFSPPHTPVGQDDLPAAPSRRPKVQGDVYAQRAIIEDLKRRQYWQDDFDFPVSRPFDSRDPSSLGPALTDTPLALNDKGFMREADVVRECLMALQGHSSVLGNDLQSNAASYCLAHTTPASFASILTRVSTLQARVLRVRDFVMEIYEAGLSVSSRHRPCRTLEAFASALDEQLRSFFETCAQKERTLSRAAGSSGSAVTTSLLGLLHDLRPADKLFAVLDDVLRDLAPAPPAPEEAVNSATAAPKLSTILCQMHAGAVARTLLDELYFAVQARLAIGDEVTAQHLCTVLCTTAGPVWAMCAGWLRDGMRVQGGEWGEQSLYGPNGEFFIERHDVSSSSPEFWAFGYTLRVPDEETETGNVVPVLFGRLSQSLLAVGKTIGLLRVMDVMHLARAVTDVVQTWPPMDSLLGGSLSLSALGDGWMAPHALEEFLQPCFDDVQIGLKQVIVERCQFAQSLAAVEGLCFMRRGDVMSEWCDRLFAKLDADGRSWADFHFLNSTFRSVTAHETGLDANVVRLSYGGHSAASASRTVRGFDGLRVEYIAPFPLNYFFSGDSMHAYSRTFAFLVQLRHAQRALDDAFLRVSTVTSRELHLLRHRLTWILSVFVDFVSSTLQSEVAVLHKRIDAAVTFDEMMLVHAQHLETINVCFLLQRETRAMHVSVLTVLDICLRFRALAVVLDAAPPAQQARKRSRKTTSRRRTTLTTSDTESDSDDDNELPTVSPVPDNAAPATTVPDTGLERDRLDNMRVELVNALSHLRHGVELLAAGTLPTSHMFNSLVFNLQAWDF